MGLCGSKHISEDFDWNTPPSELYQPPSPVPMSVRSSSVKGEKRVATLYESMESFDLQSDLTQLSTLKVSISPYSRKSSHFTSAPRNPKRLESGESYDFNETESEALTFRATGTESGDIQYYETSMYSNCKQSDYVEKSSFEMSHQESADFERTSMADIYNNSHDQFKYNSHNKLKLEFSESIELDGFYHASLERYCDEESYHENASKIDTTKVQTYHTNETTIDFPPEVTDIYARDILEGDEGESGIDRNTLTENVMRQSEGRYNNGDNIASTYDMGDEEIVNPNLIDYELVIPATIGIPAVALAGGGNDSTRTSPLLVSAKDASALVEASAVPSTRIAAGRSVDDNGTSGEESLPPSLSSSCSTSASEISPLPSTLTLASPAPAFSSLSVSPSNSSASVPDSPSRPAPFARIQSAKIREYETAVNDSKERELRRIKSFRSKNVLNVPIDKKLDFLTKVEKFNGKKMDIDSI